MISYQDFKKLDLRVGNVIGAERVENSKKLLRLEVDLGKEKKQVIAGIGEQYEPEKLIGQQVVLLANLETKVIFGLESQGMLLAAGNEENIAFLQPDKKVPSFCYNASRVGIGSFGPLYRSPRSFLHSSQNKRG